MVLVGAGLSREWGDAVNGTGFAGVRGTSPLPQVLRSNQGRRSPCAGSPAKGCKAAPIGLTDWH
ncbi:hypothetical protein E2H86_21130, partial [Pseudomonas putida]